MNNVSILDYSNEACLIQVDIFLLEIAVLEVAICID